jgi:hypothetical protein
MLMLSSLVTSRDDLLSVRSVAIVLGDGPLAGGVMDLLEDRFDFAEDVRENGSCVVDSLDAPCPLVVYSLSVSHSVISLSMAPNVRGT